MTTVSRLHRLCGWSVRCASAAVAVAICASVSAADPNKNVVTTSKNDAHKTTRKVCYTLISGSGIPQPCDRLGTIPTTAIPMTIIGNHPAERETK